MDHSLDDHHTMPGGYFYPPESEGNYNLGYGGPMAYNPVQAQHAPQPLHGGVPSYNIPLMGGHQYTNPGNVFAGTSGPHGPLPVSGSPPPPSPELNMYDHPLSPPVSGSESAGDNGLYHHSSSGTNSPAHSRSNSLVHRTARYHPHPSPSPTSSAGRRRSRSRGESDEDEYPDTNPMGIAFVENLAHSRKEATRKQRIEAEQRRRDELRDGYAKLKDVLPMSNQKSSKVSLLERATNHILYLERHNQDLEARVAQLEAEMERLRSINEKISLSVNNTPSPRQLGAKPLSPPPEASTPAPSAAGQQLGAHSLTSVKGQQPPSEHSSPSASENGSY